MKRLVIGGENMNMQITNFFIVFMEMKEQLFLKKNVGTSITFLI